MSDNFSEHTGSFRTVSTSLASQSDRDELLSPALSEVHDRLHQLAIDPNGLEKLDFIFDTGRIQGISDYPLNFILKHRAN